MDEYFDGSKPSETFQRSGSSIHYWLAGPDNGPLVVFTHGASMDHRMFDAQVPPLVALGYRVLTWDVRGHGRSKPIGGEFTVPAVAEDLLALIDHLDHETAALVGQSFGGYVSQELMLRHSERVEAVVVIGATDITISPSRLERAGLKLSSTLLRLWPDSYLRSQIAQHTAVKPAVQRYAHEATRQLSKNEFITVWKAIEEYLHEERERRIPCPLLVTHGEHDEIGIIATAAPAWAERELCRYEVVSDAGHNANQDNPAAFNDLLCSFLEEHVPT